MSHQPRKLFFEVIALRPHTQIQPSFPICCHQRTLFERFFKRRKKDPPAFDPNSAEYKKKLEAAKKKREQTEIAQVGSGGLAPSSIFEQERLKEKGKLKGRQKGQQLPKVQDWRKIKPSRIDPNPKARIKWLKKMVMKDVRARHRLNKTEKLRRTERSHVAKSPFIATSVKKLGHLARQIAGKPLTEAMIQMRFSKKRAAKDVLKHLQYARNQAIVEKRMGLGLASSDVEKKLKSKEGQQQEKITVEDRDGKKRVITDKSAMYVDEAWIGRGKYKLGRDYRAFGRSNTLFLPSTSISVVLKEEITRIRQAEEREQKRQRKKVWVPLPDRPVTAQRQYPLW